MIGFGGGRDLDWGFLRLCGRYKDGVSKRPNVKSEYKYVNIVCKFLFFCG